jgi:hypothetical protein
MYINILIHNGAIRTDGGRKQTSTKPANIQRMFEYARKLMKTE